MIKWFCRLWVKFDWYLEEGDNILGWKENCF